MECYYTDHDLRGLRSIALLLNERQNLPHAVHKVNNYKGSIYMVCDYMDHDLTGLMERRNYKFTLPQVGSGVFPGSPRCDVCQLCFAQCRRRLAITAAELGVPL